jgi:hypothetical protein
MQFEYLQAPSSPTIGQCPAPVSRGHTTLGPMCERRLVKGAVEMEGQSGTNENGDWTLASDGHSRTHQPCGGYVSILSSAFEHQSVANAPLHRLPTS